MKEPMRLDELLGKLEPKSDESLAVFAVVNLGFIESLANGVLTASDAVRFFYSGENCLFVRKQFKNKIADQVMSHGVQLPDLFDSLPPEEAFREFQLKLAVMRSLCLRILEIRNQVASCPQTPATTDNLRPVRSP
jgi:hypothetical protein